MNNCQKRKSRQCYIPVVLVDLKKSRPTYYLPGTVLAAVHNTSNSSLTLHKREAEDWEWHPWEDKATGIFWVSSKVIRLRESNFGFVKSEWIAKGSRRRILSAVNHLVQSVLSLLRGQRTTMHRAKCFQLWKSPNFPMAAVPQLRGFTHSMALFQVSNLSKLINHFLLTHSGI